MGEEVMPDYEDKVGQEVLGDPWDAPTDPAHGGKMTAEQMAERIKDLETALRNFLALEIRPTNDKRNDFAVMRSGPSLAATLDAAEALLRIDEER